MDTSQNKDIGMRQNLLRVAGKNAIPPNHIIQQQRRLSQTQIAIQTRKIIPLEHKELCPLCHRRSFIFHHSPYSKNGYHHHDKDKEITPGTFMCAKCSNKEIQFKLSKIYKLKKDIQKLTKLIQPILIKKLNQKNNNNKYYDKQLKSKQYQRSISNLRLLIQQKQKENKFLKENNNRLRRENTKRLNNLNEIKPKLIQKWEYALEEYTKKSSLYKTKQITNHNISLQISLSKLLQIADFYKMKVLPMMQLKDRDNEQRKLSMIQNIAIPSIFKIKHIRTFYGDPHNELFRFPLPTNNEIISNNNNNNNNNTSSKIYNRSHSSLMKYGSSHYEIPLKASSKSMAIQRRTPKTHKTHKKINKKKNSGSPLQKYMPRITNSISSVSAQMGIPFLTPPGYNKQKQISFGNEIISEKESKSLPKNLDDLILPPTFFSDDETEKMEKIKEEERKKKKQKKKKRGDKYLKDGVYRDNKDKVKQTEKKRKRNMSEIQKQQQRKKKSVNNIDLNININAINKISDRGRSQSLDALPISNPITLSNRLIHEPHIEHGICAALQYIVSFVLHAARYLDVELLYKMGLYRKGKRGKFIMHTFIERKGKYYRLYWKENKINDNNNDDEDDDDDDDEEEEEKKKNKEPISIATVAEHYDDGKKRKSRKKRENGGGNILEFEHGLHLLEENINDLCIKCGVKSNKLQYFQFIANLNALIKHLEIQNKTKDNNNYKIDGIKNNKNYHKIINDKKIRKPKIEPLNIINNYGYLENSKYPSLIREHSTSNTSSHSFSESTAINNSESDIVVSPAADSEHEDWDFVDL